MPKSAKGEKGPVDTVGPAVMVAKIATGEVEESTETDDGKEQGCRRAWPEGWAGAGEEVEQEEASRQINGDTKINGAGHSTF